MDATEYLERIGADHDSRDPEPWESDRLSDNEWERDRNGKRPRMLRVPWDSRYEHTDQWRTV